MPRYAMRRAGNKKLSWCWQTRATHLEVSQCHQTQYKFHMLGIVSSCAIVTLSLRRTVFFDIRLQKMSWPWNPCHRSLKVIESDTIRQIAYDFLLVFYRTIVPSVEIFNFKNAVTLKRGPSRLMEMSACDRAHTTSYWRSIVTMALFSCRFWDIQCHDL